MTDDERKELAIHVEEILVAAMRRKGILLNGVMLNRLESVSELIAQVAEHKPVLKSTVDRILSETR